MTAAATASSDDVRAWTPERKEPMDARELRSPEPTRPTHPDTLIVPRLTATALPPTPTAVVAPSFRSASTSMTLGRPISSPCSTVHASVPT